MNDYENVMEMPNIPSVVKWSVMIFGVLNIYLYKKLKISDHLVDHLRHFPLTLGSLTFLIFGIFVFVTSKGETFVEVFGTVTGIAMALSYLSSILKDAEQNPTLTGWLFTILVIVLDTLLFYLFDNNYTFPICLMQNILFMIWEAKKI